VGGSDDLSIPQAFGPIRDIARTEPSIGEPLDAGDRARLREAVLGLLSREGGTVVILEDTQYIVPQEDVEDSQGNVAHLPTTLGQDFHKSSTLPVYILHAWIWEPNPAGTFADFNPDVSLCPTAASRQVPSRAPRVSYHVDSAGQ
jgi:hypothetical protein